MPNNRYDEVFEIEIQGWIYGLSNYPGELTPQVIHRIIRELSPSFECAIDNGVFIDIPMIADKFREASRGIIGITEIASAIIAQFPRNLHLFSQDKQFLIRETLRTAYERIPMLGPQTLLLERRRENRSGCIPSVFFSHSSKDNAFCKVLGEALLQRGIRVWLDLDDLEIGDRLAATFEEKILNVDALVLVLSNHALESTWVQREVSYALAPPSHTDPIPILPVVIDDCSVPSYIADRKIIWFRMEDSLNQVLKFILRAVTGHEDYQGRPENFGTITPISDATKRSQLLTQRLTDVASMDMMDAPSSSITIGSTESENLNREVHRLRDILGFARLDGAAKDWWLAFEDVNRSRLESVVSLLEELISRDSDLEEFFNAYVMSNVQSIVGNLHYMDYLRIKKREKENR